jgi:hypothetical protein
MSLARVRSLILVSLLVIAAIVVVTLAITKDRQNSASYGGASCPAGAVPVKTRPLPDESKIKINVYNGTNHPGLAGQVAAEFKNRKFTVGKVKDITKYAHTAQLRYGPKAVAAASVVDAYFLGQAELKFDIKRTDDVVDVILGGQFTTIGTPTDVHQAIAALGNPSPPPGTCDVAK